MLDKLSKISINNKYSVSQITNRNLFSFKKLLDKDVFIKNNSSSIISFKEKLSEAGSNESRTELLKSILRVQCSVVHPGLLLPKYGDFIASKLKQGKGLEQILADKKLQSFDSSMLNKIIHGRSIREHLISYAAAQQKIKSLLAKLNLHDELDPARQKTEIEVYSDLFRESNEKSFLSPLASWSFRYNFLLDPVAKLVSQNAERGKQTKFLVVGLGNEIEEAYDYALYSYIGLNNKKYDLSKLVDMELVDYRKYDDFYINPTNPIKLDIYDNKYPISLQDNIKNKLISHPNDYLSYTYPADVLTFIYDRIYDKSKFHAGLPIEDFAKNYQGEGFDFISLNNVLQYPGFKKDELNDLIPEHLQIINPLKDAGNEDSCYEAYRALLNNILKMVKPGGLLSCQFATLEFNEQLLKHLKKLELFNNEFELLEKGIFRRKSYVVD